MKRFEVTLSTKPVIKIHDQEKLESVVCNKNSDFCKYMWHFSDVKDFCDAFALQFYYESRVFEKRDGDINYHYYKFVEGYGTFKQEDNGNWKMNDSSSIDEFGMIEIYFDDDGDLEVEWSASEI